MSPRRDTQRSEFTLVGAGRWVVLTIISFSLVTSILRWPSYEAANLPVAVLAQLAEAAACFLMMWRPRVGVFLGLLPLSLTVIFGDMDADVMFPILASATVCFRVGPIMILPVALLGTGYGLVRCLVNVRMLPLMRESVFTCSLLALLGIFLGLLLRLVLRILNRGEAQLAVLAADVTEIRSGERLRLAGELRSAVSERLARPGRAARPAPYLRRLDPPGGPGAGAGRLPGCGDPGAGAGRHAA